MNLSDIAEIRTENIIIANNPMIKPERWTINVLLTENMNVSMAHTKELMELINKISLSQLEEKLK